MCRCGRCMCLMFQVPTGNAACGSLDYAELIKNGIPRKAEDIAAIVTGMKNFNDGLYERALILTTARSEGVEFCVPLYMLIPFFGLDAILPQKRIIDLVFERNPASKVIIKPTSDESSYDLKVKRDSVILNFKLFILFDQMLLFVILFL